MKKGTAPIFQFTIPFSTDRLAAARVLFAYGDQLLLKKDTEELTLEGNTITCKLTQEDTFEFDCNRFVDIQLRVLTIDGTPYTSDIFTEFVEKCLDKEVLA